MSGKASGQKPGNAQMNGVKEVTAGMVAYAVVQVSFLLAALFPTNYNDYH
jgi:hypothetical protein